MKITSQLSTAIDYDTVTQTEYDLEVHVSDGTNVVKILGNVIVLPVNEHIPVFQSKCSF